MARTPSFAHRRLVSTPAWVVGLLAAVGVAAVGVGDVVTGPEISFSVFYVAPIALAVWYAGAGWGVGTSLAAAVTWFIADGRTYSAAWIPFWNASVRLAFFLLVTLLVRRVHDLVEQHKALAETDQLTGLANTRRFENAVAAEVERAARYGGSTSLVYVDLDGFKGVNDRWGHQTGDAVLARVGRILSERLRTIDLPARLGGDEFAVLLPQTDGPSASTVIQSLREHLEAGMREHEWPVGFSMGVVTSREGIRSAAELIKLADDLMYEVKRGGKGATLQQTEAPDAATGGEPPAA